MWRGEGADGGIGAHQAKGRVIGRVQRRSMVIGNRDAFVDKFQGGVRVKHDRRRPGVVDAGECRRRGVGPRGAVGQISGVGAGRRAVGAIRCGGHVNRRLVACGVRVAVDRGGDWAGDHVAHCNACRLDGRRVADGDRARHVEVGIGYRLDRDRHVIAGRKCLVESQRQSRRVAIAVHLTGGDEPLLRDLPVVVAGGRRVGVFGNAQLVAVHGGRRARLMRRLAIGLDERGRVRMAARVLTAGVGGLIGDGDSAVGARHDLVEGLEEIRQGGRVIGHRGRGVREVERCAAGVVLRLGVTDVDVRGGYVRVAAHGWLAPIRVAVGAAERCPTGERLGEGRVRACHRRIQAPVDDVRYAVDGRINRCRDRATSGRICDGDCSRYLPTRVLRCAARRGYRPRDLTRLPVEEVERGRKDTLGDGPIEGAIECRGGSLGDVDDGGQPDAPLFETRRHVVVVASNDACVPHLGEEVQPLVAGCRSIEAIGGEEAVGHEESDVGDP